MDIELKLCVGLKRIAALYVSILVLMDIELKLPETIPEKNQTFKFQSLF